MKRSAGYRNPARARYTVIPIELKMSRRFVVFSGLPGSGKSTLARGLAPALGLPVIDKDHILERLFDSRGIGDAVWRRALSRESDGIFQAEAEASQGALLVSFWHSPGMPPGSGTPTGWISALSRCVVHVHCACTPELAAQRFLQRQRHPGHRDDASSAAHVLASLRNLIHREPLAIQQRVDVEAIGEFDLDGVAAAVQAAFERCGG